MSDSLHGLHGVGWIPNRLTPSNDSRCNDSLPEQGLRLNPTFEFFMKLSVGKDRGSPTPFRRKVRKISHEGTQVSTNRKLPNEPMEKSEGKVRDPKNIRSTSASDIYDIFTKRTQPVWTADFRSRMVPAVTDRRYSETNPIRNQSKLKWNFSKRTQPTFECILGSDRKLRRLEPRMDTHQFTQIENYQTNPTSIPFSPDRATQPYQIEDSLTAAEISS
jgi:hypothetical protein